MKQSVSRLLAVILACLIVVTSFFTATAFAADNDFTVENGVLLSYNGKSATVTVPDSVKAIGDRAFENNTSLSSVTLSDSVVKVGERAFSGCTSLSKVNGGDNVTEVGAYAFSGTPYLDLSTAKYLMLGKTLLWYNGTAGTVSLPTSCISVAPFAFMRCTYLTSVTAYDGLVSIGAGAFFGCPSLKEVFLPSTLTAVGACAFDGTPYLSSLGEFATVGDGVLIKYYGSSSTVNIPDNVRRIAPRAFTSSKVTEVNIPDTVYSVDSYAFTECTGLTDIQLPDGLINIGDGAFSGCKSLKTVKTPKTLKYLGQYSFAGASSLKGAQLLGDNLSVSHNAFYGCTSLDYALMSDGVTALYDKAFDGCTSLEGVSMPPSLTKVSSSAFGNSENAVAVCEPSSTASKVLSDHTFDAVHGNVDDDGVSTVLDATVIQGYIAKIETFNGLQIASSDLNFDGQINILDALYIQMSAARLI